MADHSYSLPENYSSNMSTIERDVLFMTLEVIIAIAAVVGNGLVIVAFFKHQRLRRITNYYIASLAVADFLLGLLGIPFAVLESVGLPVQRELCLLTLSVLLGLCAASVFNLLGICLDRYWAIIYPVSYRNVTPKISSFIIGVCWIAGILVGSLPFLGWSNWRNWNDSNPQCIFVEVMRFDYLVFLNFATFLVPMPLLIISYTHIFIAVRRQSRKVASASVRKISKTTFSDSRREQTVARNLSVIVFVFIASWTPLHVMNTVQAICDTCTPPLWFAHFSVFLTHLNSALNPPLYACSLRDVRAALRSMFCSAFAAAQDVAYFEENGSQIKERTSSPKITSDRL